MGVLGLLGLLGLLHSKLRACARSRLPLLPPQFAMVVRMVKDLSESDQAFKSYRGSKHIWVVPFRTKMNRCKICEDEMNCNATV